MFGTLYIVSTPIGNLEDITLRALEILKTVDLVLCEDTRVTQKILNRYEISVSTQSYHHHSNDQKIQHICDLLSQGKNLALVSDAGTPGISDPGNVLIDYITNKYRGEEAIDIVPIPGASSLTAALAVSGFPTDKFLFLGFIPHKNKRRKFLEEVSESKYTVSFFESSHRIKKCLQEMSEVLDENRTMVVCRELTKKFESIYRGTLSDILSLDIPDKGEFVLVVSPKGYNT
ncbi:MAG: 16S rRNA (cytidine(1402)-2'-O)-methyltransferase [Candidatus Magasanikbacteria bacterium CG11_big_fil_rev_8_21_14_0_20_39_34]|uniref:Ribosomal RNA small subunit methyltransferase I n=1 Tax=Candidatus Magasanikbacteria bacterium CG11_big_fil_rev_8_21_14_0_20_39_34 TaxID=1974653 RepID=A0A2H0N5I9_9BACT|nr:MAG: 16S rRNA (cytidine(1402)-2'-O)-methyltransferase [Candidatus Magasanikbacteria bacterium CG11_big_fil_rev_8_21_14_0_20_39_34]